MRPVLARGLAGSLIVLVATIATLPTIAGAAAPPPQPEHRAHADLRRRVPRAARGPVRADTRGRRGERGRHPDRRRHRGQPPLRQRRLLRVRHTVVAVGQARPRHDRPHGRPVLRRGRRRRGRLHLGPVPAVAVRRVVGLDGPQRHQPVGGGRLVGQLPAVARDAPVPAGHRRHRLLRPPLRDRRRHVRRDGADVGGRRRRGGVRRVGSDERRLHDHLGVRPRPHARPGERLGHRRPLHAWRLGADLGHRRGERQPAPT